MTPQINKLLKELGIEADEAIDDDAAIDLVKQKLAIQERAGSMPAGKVPIPLVVNIAVEDFIKKLFVALEIDLADVDRNGIIDEDEAIRLIKEKCAANAVDQALTDKKIKPGEKEWALKFAAENLPAFEQFVKCRAEQLEFIPYRRPEERLRSAIDDLQADMNRQLGLSPAGFAKYNGQGH